MIRFPRDRVSGWTALRIGLPGLAVLVLVVLEPNVLVATVRNARTAAISGIGLALLIVWALLLKRVVTGEALRTVLTVAPVLVVVGGLLTVALGPDQVVDEALPPVADRGPTTQRTAAPPSDAPTELPDEPPGPPIEDPPTSQATVDPPPPEPPPGPVEVSRGSFVGLDAHTAVGEAAIYDLGDGQRIVRLEDVTLHRVPDPYVYLVPGSDATGPDEGWIDLGPLTGNVGSSNYTIPPEVELSGDWTVLVWCVPFASPVGAASQVTS